MLGLDSVPFNIYLNFIIPNLKIEDVGNMAMTNKSLKEICDSNEVWKYLYNKTNPLKVLDTSIHIGDHYFDKHLSKEELLKQYEVIKPQYWWRLSHTWSEDYKFTGCCDNCFNSLQPLYKKNPLYNSREVHFIDNLPEEIKSEYYEECRKIHLEENEIQGHTSTNLCINTDHYIQSTLGNYTNKVNYKSFKKVTLRKYLTKRSRELQKARKILNRDKSEEERYKNKLKYSEEKAKESQEKFDKLNRFCENTKLFLNI